MAVQRTLSIIKPDAVAKNVIGEIYTRFERANLKIVAARMMRLSQAAAEGFYAVHKGRPFFKDLVDFMTSGPVMIQVLEGRRRDTEKPGPHGRDRSEKSGQGHYSRRFRSKHRRERGSRLRLGGERRRGDRVLLSHSGYLHALGRTPRMVNLLGLTPSGTAGLLRGARREALSGKATAALDSSGRRGQLRRDERRVEGVPRGARRRPRSIAAPAVQRDTRGRGRHAQVAARRGHGQCDRDGVHSGARARHAVHLLAGRLRSGMLVLLDGPAGVQSQSLAWRRSSASSGLRTVHSRPAPSRSGR